MGGASRDRGQTAVVGVAILLGITVLAVAGLSATAGSIVEEGAASAAATRVADDLETALGPTPGPRETTVELGAGSLRVVNRSVWILDGDGVVWAGHAGAVVYADGGHRVTGFAGAVVRRDDRGSRLVAPSRLAAANGTLYLGVPVLNASGADGVATGGHRLDLTLRTDARAERVDLPRGEWPALLLRYAVRRENPHVEFFDSHYWGYATATFTRDDATFTAYSVDKSARENASKRTLASYRVPAGRVALRG